tara:strand:- start:289 stop:888 length:600 start_codon:yes stop_codon:yes gene_type:complete
MINKESLINFFNLLNQKAKDHYDDFNSLDGQLGDGDLGITLTNGIEAIYNNKDNFENDIGKIFLLCAKLFTKVSSSSFGTLTAISFLTLGKLYKDKQEIEDIKIVEGLEQIIKAISARGKSNLEDKTVLDSINEIMISIKSNPDNDLGIIAYEASKNALNKFKGKHCKIGRARMFAEKSKELDDPGMYALCVLSSIFKK